MRDQRRAAPTSSIAPASRDGHLFVAWQSLSAAKTGEPTSDIWLRELHQGKWREPVRVSESPKSDWEPALAAGPDGRAWVAWDTYDRGNYDVMFRAYRGGRLERRCGRVTSSERFEAQADVAVDAQGRPWIAWNESGVNWGKDQGFLITPPMSTPLHQERSIRVVMWDGARFQELRAELPIFYVYRLFPNFEKPRLAFDGRGGLNLSSATGRGRCRAASARSRSGRASSRVFTTARGRGRCRSRRPSGSIEKLAALTVDREGDLWAAWMTDGRTLSDAKPRNAEVLAANLGQTPSSASISRRSSRRGSSPRPRPSACPSICASPRTWRASAATRSTPAARATASIAATSTATPTCRRTSSTTAR